jgi:hypothetical protein
MAGKMTRCVCGKAIFHTRRAAEREARQHRKSDRRVRGFMSAYRCSEGFWHIGHGHR